jgi:hypothetical protein
VSGRGGAGPTAAGGVTVVPGAEGARRRGSCAGTRDGRGRRERGE